MTMPAHDENLKCLLDSESEPFLEQLRGLRYADKTVLQKRAIAQEFSQWALQKLITVDNLNRDSVATFLARPSKRATTRIALERAAVHMFLQYLQRKGRLPCLAQSQTGSDPGNYLRRYESYLRNDRGLADNAVHAYLPFIRDVLSAQSAQTGCLRQDAFETLNIQSFLLAHSKNRSEDRHQDVDRHRDPDLRLHCALAGSIEGLDPEVLLDPFERLTLIVSPKEKV